jgi:hypothetical protein
MTDEPKNMTPNQLRRLKPGFAFTGTSLIRTGRVASPFLSWNLNCIRGRRLSVRSDHHDPWLPRRQTCSIDSNRNFQIQSLRSRQTITGVEI